MGVLIALSFPYPWEVTFRTKSIKFREVFTFLESIPISIRNATSDLMIQKKARHFHYPNIAPSA
jgi:hypothetical protein